MRQQTADSRQQTADSRQQTADSRQQTPSLQINEGIISRENNFDLLRLIAAIQVFIGHASEHLGMNLGYFGKILGYFPGVPIFFAISGFLITLSYDRNKDIKKYLHNRFLRIYPALWVCTVFIVFTFIFFKAFSLKTYFTKDFIIWFFCQITIFQYYTPDILRGWGVSAPNGSLWTIPVEIEFYVAIVLIFILLKKIPILIKIGVLFIISYGINMYYSYLTTTFGENNFLKLIGVSIFPHLFNFIIGAAIYLLWKKIRKIIENKGIIWLSIYSVYTIIFSIILKGYSPSYYPNMLGLVATLLLSITTISLAFSFKTFSKKYIRGIDLSYGIYIYHMPIINIFVNYNRTGYPGYYMIIIFWIILILSFLSWTFVEKRCLLLKKK
jgi:peptidoglycan/LPS O-acetylase OafA/YrhL